MEPNIVVPTSSDLLRRLQAGESVALAELFETHRTALRSAIRRIVRDEATADDLAQETFLRALQHSDQWRERDGCGLQWLMGIARHCALDYCKAAYYRRARSQVKLKDVPASSEAPESRILGVEREQLLHGAVSRLDPEQRTVIELAYWAGLTQVSIACQLHQPLGTIKGRTRAALVRLRALIDQPARYPA